MRLMVVIAVLSLAASSATSWAGGGCCAAGKSKAKGEYGSLSKSCGDSLAKLRLTEDQKVRIAEMEKACAAEGNTKEACEKWTGEIKKILTADQLEAWESGAGS